LRLQPTGLSFFKSFDVYYGMVGVFNCNQFGELAAIEQFNELKPGI
jgi:hypothetical protein